MQHVENLHRTARLLRRIHDIGGPSEFEGVSVVEIVSDVLMAANAAQVQEVQDNLLWSKRVDAPLAKVIPLKGAGT